MRANGMVAEDWVYTGWLPGNATQNLNIAKSKLCATQAVLAKFALSVPTYRAAVISNIHPVCF
jgi:hypothetical protein